MGGKTDLAPLRAWWLQRQGLTPATAPKTIEACVRQAGWLATSGSTGVYLSIRARMPAASRDAIDRAAIDGVTVIEVPGAHARPSVLVPREEMALALRLHAATFQKHIAPLFRSGRINEAARRRVAALVCQALDEGPLSSLDIRKRIAHPDAGDLLVGALVDLAVRGIVRRFPADGRLDSAKYIYELWHPEDRPDLDGEGDAADVVAKALERFLGRHGPATVEELTSWADLSKGAVRKVLGTLGAEPVAIPGWAKEAWLLPDDLSAWRSFRGERGDRVVLLPYRDPYVYARRGPAVLARSADARVLGGDLKPARIGGVDGLKQHAILCGGDLVGIWEYDPDAQAVVTRLWSADARLRRRVAAAAPRPHASFVSSSAMRSSPPWIPRQNARSGSPSAGLVRSVRLQPDRDFG